MCSPRIGVLGLAKLSLFLVLGLHVSCDGALQCFSLGFMRLHRNCGLSLCDRTLQSWRPQQAVDLHLRIFFERRRKEGPSLLFFFPQTELESNKTLMRPRNPCYAPMSPEQQWHPSFQHVSVEYIGAICEPPLGPSLDKRIEKLLDGAAAIVESLQESPHLREHMLLVSTGCRAFAFLPVLFRVFSCDNKQD